MEGTLFVVATPIGNLADFSDRAKETLKQCKLVFCEDTRVTGKLCKAFGIASRLISCHHHNEASRIELMYETLAGGSDIAIVSDAGTPGISDPGSKLVKAARAKGFKICPIAGPSALITAISVAGLESTAFQFIGFLPSKESARKKIILAQTKEMPWIFYEAPHRIKETMTDLSLLLPVDFRVGFFRELTKKFEEVWVGTIKEVQEKIDSILERGEFVVIVEPVVEKTDNEVLTEKQILLLSHLLKTFSVKESVAILAEHEELAKNKIYEYALKIKNKMK